MSFFQQKWPQPLGSSGKVQKLKMHKEKSYKKGTPQNRYKLIDPDPENSENLWYLPFGQIEPGNTPLAGSSADNIETSATEQEPRTTYKEQNVGSTSALFRPAKPSYRSTLPPKTPTPLPDNKEMAMNEQQIRALVTAIIQTLQVPNNTDKDFKPLIKQSFLEDQNI